MRAIKIIQHDTLEAATEEQVFDYIAAHLLRQGRKSALGAETISEMCMYQHPIEDGTINYDGSTVLRCAGGALFPVDYDKFDIATNGSAWDEIIAEGEHCNTHKHSTLIWDMQTIHDASAPDEWLFKLKALAHLRDIEFDEDYLRTALMVAA